MAPANAMRKETPITAPVNHLVGLDCQASTGTRHVLSTAHCRIEPYLDQGGACGAAGPASAPGSAVERPARRTPGHVTGAHQISPALGYTAVQRTACAPRPDRRPVRRPCAVAAALHATSTTSPDPGCGRELSSRKGRLKITPGRGMLPAPSAQTMRIRLRTACSGWRCRTMADLVAAPTPSAATGLQRM